MPNYKKVGQRYQIGDRVLKKTPSIPQERMLNKAYKPRYGVVESVDTCIQANGRVDYYYCVKWDDSGSKSSTRHMQHRLLPVDMPKRNRKPDPLKEGYQEVSPGIMFKEEKL